MVVVMTVQELVVATTHSFTGWAAPRARREARIAAVCDFIFAVVESLRCENRKKESWKKWTGPGHRTDNSWGILKEWNGSRTRVKSDKHKFEKD